MLLSTTGLFLWLSESKNSLDILSKSSLVKREIIVKWKFPPPSWIKLDVDGSVCEEGSSASCGGILRDDSGKWIVGFSKRIGAANTVEAELWGLKNGLPDCLGVGP